MPTYKVWSVASDGMAYQVAKTTRLRDLPELVAPWRDGYVYVLRWDPPAKTYAAKRHQPRPQPTCRHIWGCFSGMPHTNDLRADIRRVLRG